MGFFSFFSSAVDTVLPEAGDRIRLSGKRTRIPFTGLPYEVEMGQQRLQIHPEPTAVPRDGPPAFLVFDPERYFSGIGHFLRLEPGQKLAIDYREAYQRQVFGNPREAFRRHLQINHGGDALVFRDPISELGTYVSVLHAERDVERLNTRRRRALRRMTEILGRPIQALARDQALATLREVNLAVRAEPFRRKDWEGNPGALLELPANVTPILIGDLHAQVDNLLKILSEPAYLEALERGESAMIFLGDAVHPELPGELERMDTSLLIMDLIFKLKLWFPSQVFFLVGNHDSFSMDVMKAGVPQSLLWDKWVCESRGEEYRDELAVFYQQAPLVALSEDFCACHAGPPRAKVSRDILVNARQSPNLVHELTWTRVKTPGFPAGYIRGDVRRFRKSLGLEEDAPFIVGHYPFSNDGTVWLNVAQIPHHHILYSARPDQLAVFTRIEGDMVPQIYPSEPIMDWINADPEPAVL